MDPVAQFAVDLLRDKIERTHRVLPNGRTVVQDADTICGDLERIIAQVEKKAIDPTYEAPQLARTDERRRRG